MNRIHSLIWNASTATYVAVAENFRSCGAKSSFGLATGGARLVPNALAFSLMMVFGSVGHARPADGVISAGDASITGGAGTTTIHQTTTPDVAINWPSFNVGAAEAVCFVQPTSS